jgi:hypothetical protein
VSGGEAASFWALGPYACERYFCLVSGAAITLANKKRR